MTDAIETKLREQDILSRKAEAPLKLHRRALEVGDHRNILSRKAEAPLKPVKPGPGPSIISHILSRKAEAPLKHGALPGEEAGPVRYPQPQG